jgi:hypothetical protein
VPRVWLPTACNKKLYSKGRRNIHKCAADLWIQSCKLSHMNCFFYPGINSRSCCTCYNELEIELTPTLLHIRKTLGSDLDSEAGTLAEICPGFPQSHAGTFPQIKTRSCYFQYFPVLCLLFASCLSLHFTLISLKLFQFVPPKHQRNYTVSPIRG